MTGEAGRVSSLGATRDTSIKATEVVVTAEYFIPEAPFFETRGKKFRVATDIDGLWNVSVPKFRDTGATKKEAIETLKRFIGNVEETLAVLQDSPEPEPDGDMLAWWTR